MTYTRQQLINGETETYENQDHVLELSYDDSISTGPWFVHFNGAFYSYRTFQAAQNRFQTLANRYEMSAA